ncbi:cytochrome P450 71D9-like [Pistacia vera]|uniref:cytochrome P450 71D9-like n=1 Tax=Pistacia vera TaxID=55513 RepID=UPI001262C25D|nr:cytochrome P450 71D9-like [Pistacia vera]
MELVFPSFSILLSFLIFVFMVIKIGKRFKTNDGTLSLPPGPQKLPLIVNLHQLAALGSLGCLPHRGLRELAKIYGPFMHLQLGEISTIVVSSPEFTEQVMKTHDAVFASRPCNELANFMSYGYTDVIFSPYGKYWRKLEKIYTLELLSAKRVQSLRSLREEEMSNLIDSIASVAMWHSDDTWKSTWELAGQKREMVRGAVLEIQDPSVESTVMLQKQDQ